MEIYVKRNREDHGPYSLEQLRELVEDGTFLPHDSAAVGESGEWTLIKKIPGFQVEGEPTPETVALAELSCPYCRGHVAASELRPCPTCRSPHHEECWRENGGCTVYGCSETPSGGEPIRIGPAELRPDSQEEPTPVERIRTSRPRPSQTVGFWAHMLETDSRPSQTVGFWAHTFQTGSGWGRVGMIALLVIAGAVLLVMFQPSRQTFPKDEVGESDALDNPTGADHSTFNDGLEGNPPVTPAEPTRVTGGGERFSPTPPNPGELLVPTEPATMPPSDLRPSDVMIYKVKRGDSLWSIASKHNLTLERLLSVNNIDTDTTFTIGQEIFLPVTATTPPLTGALITPVETGIDVYVVQRGDRLSRIARTYGVSVNALQDANNLRSGIIQIGQRLLVPGVSARVPVPGQVTHIVKTGESLTSIAARYGVSLQLLIGMNNIEHAALKVGQMLIIKPAPIPDAPPSAPDNDETDDIESIFKNAGEFPVIPLSPQRE